MPRVPPTGFGAVALGCSAIVLASCGNDDEVRGAGSGAVFEPAAACVEPVDSTPAPSEEPHAAAPNGPDARAADVEAADDRSADDLRPENPPAEVAIGFDEVAWKTGLYDLAAGWGLSWGDVDADGDPDLFVSNHMHYPSALYVNVDGMRFRRASGELGVAVGLDDHLGVWADFDADGFPDLYATSGFHRDDHLMRNRRDGTFEDVTAQYSLDLGRTGRGRSAIWSDLSDDGRLDLLVLNLYTPDLFYLREPGATFREVALESGLANSLGKEGAAVGDLDGDGDLDVYVPLFQDLLPNLYFVNRGDGTFVERSKEAGIDLIGASRSASLGDYDGDGRLDIYVTRGDTRGDVLFRNRGDGTFEDASAAAGIDVVGRGIRNAGFADLDNDGWLDLYVSCGGSDDGPNGPNHLLRNRGDGTFEDVTAAAGVVALSPGNSASLALADYDLDGFLDFALTNGGGARAISGPHMLFRNRGLGGGRWLRIVPRGGPGNLDGIGAQVRVRLPDGRVLYREAGGVRVMAQDEATVHVGLGASDHAREVNVRWTGGGNARMQGLPAGQTVVVAQGSAPRLIASHPAALLGEVATFDLERARGRAAASIGGSLPAAVATDLAERQDEVLAWALARELARDVLIGPGELQEAWNEMRPEFDLPDRYLVEHIGIGRFTTFDSQPPLPWDKANAIAEGMRAGRNLLDLSIEHGVRAWARVYKSESDSTEPLLGAADDSTRGYIESGWLTRAMLVERYGEEHAEKITNQGPGGVYGPIKLREGRDVQEPEQVWPILRVFRKLERKGAARGQRVDFERALQRLVRQRKVAALLAAAAAPHRQASGAPRPPGWFEGLRYEVGPLAAAARARGLDGLPEVRAALERARAEAELDVALRAIAQKLDPPAEEVRARAAARRDVWTLPRRARGTVLFFARGEEAAEFRRRLDAGATVPDLIAELDIPPLTEPDARGTADHYERVVYDAAMWARVAPGGSFEQLAGLVPGTASDVLASANGAIVFALDEVLDPEPPDERSATARAAAELRRRQVDTLVDEILWSE